MRGQGANAAGGGSHRASSSATRHGPRGRHRTSRRVFFMHTKHAHTRTAGSCAGTPRPPQRKAAPRCAARLLDPPPRRLPQSPAGLRPAPEEQQDKGIKMIRDQASACSAAAGYAISTGSAWQPWTAARGGRRPAAAAGRGSPPDLGRGHWKAWRATLFLPASKDGSWGEERRLQHGSAAVRGPGHQRAWARSPATRALPTGGQRTSSPTIRLGLWRTAHCVQART